MDRQEEKKNVFFFQMPLHYPRYSKEDYEQMPEWKLERLLAQYGLPTTGDLSWKREFAMGAFLWPEAAAAGDTAKTLVDCPKKV